MIVLNKMHHSDEQWSALAKEPDDGPVFMINLFKFRDRAEYADGRKTDLSGLEAYQIHGAATSKHVAEIGGKILHSSTDCRNGRWRSRKSLGRLCDS